MCCIDRQSKLLLKTQDWEGENEKESGRERNQLWLLATVSGPVSGCCGCRHCCRGGNSGFRRVSYKHSTYRHLEGSHSAEGAAWCCLVYSHCCSTHNHNHWPSQIAMDLLEWQQGETQPWMQPVCEQLSSSTRGTLCFVSCDSELLMGTWLCSVVQGPVATALTSDTSSMHRPSLLGQEEEERGAGGRGSRGGIDDPWAPCSWILPPPQPHPSHPNTSIHPPPTPLPTPPSLTPPPPHTLHLMPINDSFMWLLWACSDVCPIDLLTLLQASEPRSPFSQ